MADEGGTVKVVVVGDGTTGKTCLLVRFADEKFSEEYIASTGVGDTVLVNNLKTKTCKGKKYTLELIDTGGQEDLKEIRKIFYPDASIFVICYDISSKKTLKNILHTWNDELPEKNKDGDVIPKILVGNKADMRSSGTNQDLASESEGRDVAKKIGAKSYNECSAKSGDKVEEVFDAALLAYHKMKNPSSLCNIL